MEQFQPGEYVHVSVAFEHVVPIKDAYIVFVHQEDANEHIMETFVMQDDPPRPLTPSPETVLWANVFVGEDKKPGVYTLDRITFMTFGNKQHDFRGDAGEPELYKFEVIPELAFAPVVKNVSMSRSSL